MALNGIAKMIEECGELMQIAGKKLAYYTTDTHPDGGPPITLRMEDEIADVIASCQTVIDLHVLDRERIERRIQQKRSLFLKWHHQTDNNTHGVDAR